MREPIEAIYGFARGADDIADEGDMPDAERLAGLDRYLEALSALESGREPAARFDRIARAVRDYRLPTTLLADLIDAFRQDVVKKRYASFDELLDYSRRSANPVGRLVLHVFARSHPRFAQPHFAAQSDRICSALQLVNFWQDVAIDWAKGRVYLPAADMAQFGVHEAHIGLARCDESWRRLIVFEVERTRLLLESGRPLTRALPLRLNFELKLILAGGLRILAAIDAAQGDVFRHRPMLKRRDWAAMSATALFRP